MKYYYNNYGAYYKNAERLPVNKPVWAIAYNINDDTERKRLSCKPTLGEIINADESGRRFWTTHCFVPYKKARLRKENLALSIFKPGYMRIPMKKQSRCTTNWFKSGFPN